VTVVSFWNNTYYCIATYQITAVLLFEEETILHSNMSFDYSIIMQQYTILDSDMSHYCNNRQYCIAMCQITVVLLLQQ